jgi:hypothetical protein
MNRLKQVLDRSPMAWAMAGTYLLAFLFMSALAPLHLTIRHDPQAHPRLTIDGKPVELVQRQAVAPIEVVIENRSSTPTSVQFVFPQTSLGNTLQASDFIVEQGDWREWELGGRLISTQPGSRVRFRSAATDLSLAFVMGPDQGVVSVGADTIDLKKEQEGFLPIPLTSGTQASFTSRIFEWKALRARLTGLSPGSQVELSLATQPLGTWTAGPDGTLAVEASRTQVFSALVKGHAQGLRLVLYALLVLGASLLAGAGFFLGWTRRSSIMEGAVLAASCALAVLCVVTTSLSYVLSGRMASLLAVLLFAGAVVMSLRRLLPRRAEWHVPRPGPGAAVLGVGLVLGLLGAFWPTFQGSDWFLGMLQTDAYYYSGLPQTLKSQSLIALGTVNGFSMRAIDLVIVGFFSNALGLATREAMLASSMAVFILTGLLGYVTAFRITRSELAGGCIGALTCLWAPSAGLYMEAYYTQYLLVFGLTLLAATSIALHDRLGTAEPVLAPSTETLAFGAATVFCLALYPYFTLMPAALVGVVLFERRRHLGSELRAGIKVMALSLALSNVNLLVILNSMGTQVFVASLNEIARNVVFPFYREPRFFSFVLGMSPFHTSMERLEALDREFSNGNHRFALMRDYVGFINSKSFLIGLVLVLLALLVSNFRGWRQLRSRNVLVATLMLYFSLAAVMGLREQTYSYAKLMWTASTLLPLFLGVLLLAPPPPIGKSPSAQPGWRFPAFGVLTVGAALALALNNLGWYGNSQGLALSRSHISLVHDISGLMDATKRHLAASPGTRPVTFTAPAAGLKNTDKDRVLLGQLVPALDELGLSCTNCTYNALFGTVEWMRAEQVCGTEPHLVVLLGNTGHRCSPKDKVLYAGEYVTLLESQRPGGEVARP